jgi:hypothetical protein
MRITNAYLRETAPFGGLKAYEVRIGGLLLAHLVGERRRWRLHYGTHELTLVSPAAAVAFVERYADRIAAGKAVEEPHALSRVSGR